jgi:hypothetical protein
VQPQHKAFPAVRLLRPPRVPQHQRLLHRRRFSRGCIRRRLCSVVLIYLYLFCCHYYMPFHHSRAILPPLSFLFIYLYLQPRPRSFSRRCPALF